MKNNYIPSINAINLIKQFEGCKLKAYYDDANILTIGYGHTNNVTLGMCIDQNTAEKFLQEDLTIAGNFVNKLVTTSITQNMFDALTSFVFNLGYSRLMQSTLLKKININPYDTEIRNEFKRWIYCNNNVAMGLVRRRAAEVKLYFTS